MKPVLSLLLAFVTTALPAAALREAQFTRVINEVKKLPDQAPAQTASVGDKINGKTAVSTGAKSRAELKFGDGTLTRLGANSIFSLEQGSRNLDLQQGTLLLQVPKEMGGARVRTAAITAAVTGTTIMVEYEPNGYIKVIVLEGSLDLFRNDKPSEFRTIGAGDMIIMKPDSKFIPEPVQVDLKRLKASSKLTNNEDFEPLGNDRNLQDADKDQQDAKNAGKLLNTSLVIPGQGTRVTLTDDAVTNLLKSLGIGSTTGTTTGGSTTTPTQTTPPPDSPAHPPHLGGQAVIDGDAQIVTDPTLYTTFDGDFATGQGSLYKPSTDGGLGQYLYSLPTTPISAPGTVDAFLASKGTWSTFLVDDLVIHSTPQIDSQNGPKNLILASDGQILLTGPGPEVMAAGSSSPKGGLPPGHSVWDLDNGTFATSHSSSRSVSHTRELPPAPNLNALVLAARGDIIWDSTFSMTGTAQDVLLYTQGTEGKGASVSITADPGVAAVSIPQGSFNIAASGDITIDSRVVMDNAVHPSPKSTGALNAGEPTITAASVKMTSGGALTVSGKAQIAASNRIDLTSRLGLTITDSGLLGRINCEDLLAIALSSSHGDVIIGTPNAPGAKPKVLTGVSIDGSSVDIQSMRGDVLINSADISANVLKVSTLKSNGELIIGDSTLTAATSLKLYAQGSNGTVHFVSNSTLDGPTTIAGNTVLIDEGVDVNVKQPNSFNVHSNHHLYNDGDNGNFTHCSSNLNFVSDTATGPHKRTFDSRPGL